MSVTNVICQPQHRCLHVLVDGATYLADGTIVGLGVKAWPVPSWPGVVCGRGNALGIMFLAQELSWKFQTFDALIAGIESALPAIVRRIGIEENVELILAGWSAERSVPESYVINLDDSPPAGISEAEATEHRENGTAFLPAAFELCRLPNAVVGPIPTDKEIIAADFPGWDVDASPSEVVELLKLMIQMQRRSVYADCPQYVGGFAALTTVRPESIEQKILLRWEDRIGEKIIAV